MDYVAPGEKEIAYCEWFQMQWEPAVAFAWCDVRRLMDELYTANFVFMLKPTNEKVG